MDSLEFLPFRFVVTLFNAEMTSHGHEDVLCKGAFSEVSGFEASMTPKTIKEGGRNWGEVQLAGPTSFSALVLKRGVTRARDLHAWFDMTTRRGGYGLRLDGRIDVYDRGVGPDANGRPVMSWGIERAMATKLKGPDLSSTASQIAIEELHLVHEGMILKSVEDAASNHASSEGGQHGAD